MQKTELIQFLKKAYLGGIVDTFKAEIADKNMIIDINGGSVFVYLNANVDLPDGELIISNVEKLFSILSILNEDIDVSYEIAKNYAGVSITNFLKFTDSNLTAHFKLSDPYALESKLSDRPNRKFEDVPELDYGAKIVITKALIDKFAKAKRALSDSEVVAFKFNTATNQTEIIVNYKPTTESNTIKFQVDTSFTDEVSEIHLNLGILTSIFATNPDFKDATLQIQSGDSSVVLIHFLNDDFEAKYLIKALEFTNA